MPVYNYPRYPIYERYQYDDDTRSIVDLLSRQNCGILLKPQPKKRIKNADNPFGRAFAK